MRNPAGLALMATAVLSLTGCAMWPFTLFMTPQMSFFVTSVGIGKGGDLGGLAGADAHCQRLAAAAGGGGKTWSAYLSVPSMPASPSASAVAAVHARDRIGSGPWFNAKGERIARDVAHLHNGNNITKATALDERGNTVKGRGDTPTEHDILTGSRADGTAFAPHTDTTCGGWTKSGEGSAVVGHHDRVGPTSDNWSTAWNFSHHTPACSPEGLARVGGAGKLYCFARN